jgi:hypothetical protein
MCRLKSRSFDKQGSTATALRLHMSVLCGHTTYIRKTGVRMSLRLLVILTFLGKFEIRLKILHSNCQYFPVTLVILHPGPS